MQNLPSDTGSETEPVPAEMDTAAVEDAVPSPYSVSARTKYALIALIILLSFFAAYGFASARSRTAAPLPVAGAGGAACAGGESACGKPTEAAAASGDACTGCDTAAPTQTPQGAAVIDGDVQRINVDVSAGYFDPTIIDIAAGVPTEITFGQGSGCLSEVQFPQFDIAQDLTNGGAVIKLPALDPGEYQFNCGMQMVFGTLVVH